MTSTNDDGTYPIPKILHQFWLGDQSIRPTKFLDTWKAKHPDWEYILWTEEEIERRGVVFECGRQIAEIEEINGKADIVRWEILYQFGGVAMDADSYCLETMEPDIFLSPVQGWSTFENEIARKGLVACGAMGFPPRATLLRDIIDHIQKLDLHPSVNRYRAWVTVAVHLLTQMLQTGKYPEFLVFPSYMFIPVHFSGVRYRGHKKVYAYQEWGSTKQNYSVMNEIVVPPEFLVPAKWVSVLIPNYNTPKKYLRECFESILNQTGHFGMEIVFVDDGSSEDAFQTARSELARFSETNARFIQVKLVHLEQNGGIAAALRRGTELCSHEYIVRMDADDIMIPERIEKQIAFMDASPQCPVSGGQVRFFRDMVETGDDCAEEDDQKVILHATKHPEIVTWSWWKNQLPTPSPWFANHPTLIWRKSVLVDKLDGGYDPSIRFMEDWELELRTLKHIGPILNTTEILVLYRLHGKQLTHEIQANVEAHDVRRNIIETICMDNEH
jgi:GT2 family glycosyltransferase